jgi:plastocyanin
MRAARGGVVLALAVLAGCGDAPAAAPARDGRVTIAQVDFRFRPQHVEARAGRLRLTVVNRARLAHTLRIVRDGRERVRVTSQLPGRRTAVTARLEPGSYRMLCALANHEELGMHGTLVVR